MMADGQAEQPDDTAAPLRRRVATLHGLADGMAGTARRFAEGEAVMRGVHQQIGLDPDAVSKIRRGLQASQQEMRLACDVEAAHALAYAEMMAAGGSDDEDAYRQYTEATELYIALLPKGDMPHESGGSA